MKTLNRESTRSVTQTTTVNQNFGTMITSKTSYWFWIVIGLAVLAFATIQLIPESATPQAYIRYIFAFILVAFLPGYCLTQTLFPKQETMDLIERITFSIGLSFAITALTGLFLSFSPFKLTLETALPTLGGLVIVLAVVGIIRSYKTQ
ncbi:MAG: DUF1616 domain-containing protein [Candidatus Bathyarchaeota archaeon]|nr:DUF1616 domain-containing protein [Candidatus Bathyarchaeota archaeon]